MSGIIQSSVLVAGPLSVTPSWTKYTYSHTAFQTAGLTNAVNVLSLPAKAILVDAVIRPTTAFAGGAIATYTLSLGIVGSLTKYIGNSDVMAAVTATLNYRVANYLVTGLESFTGATQIQVNAISSVANLSASTAGAVDIYLLTSTLP